MIGILRHLLSFGLFVIFLRKRSAQRNSIVIPLYNKIFWPNTNTTGTNTCWKSQFSAKPLFLILGTRLSCVDVHVYSLWFVSKYLMISSWHSSGIDRYEDTGCRSLFLWFVEKDDNGHFVCGRWHWSWILGYRWIKIKI